MSKLFTFRRKSSKKTSGVSKDKNKSKTSLIDSIKNQTSHWNYAKITKYFLAFGVIITLVTTYVWYSQLYMTPERKFWLAINNSMATPSVVRTLTQGGSGNQVVQDYRFNFAPQRVVQNKVVYTEKSATTDTTVTTEGIVYPTEEYLRYTEFTNSRSDGQDNADIDEVLGKWALQVSEDEDAAKLNYLSEQVSLVIFGNYGSGLRNDMLNELKNRQVYGDNLGVPLEDKLGEEDVYVYSVSVKLRDYAEILNKAFESAGYGKFPPLSPDNYREDARVNGSVIVSRDNNSIVGINFGGREERYGNYGIFETVEKPEATMTVEELQQQVQTLLQSSL
jgi:hypothetical protein